MAEIINLKIRYKIEKEIRILNHYLQKYNKKEYNQKAEQIHYQYFQIMQYGQQLKPVDIEYCLMTLEKNIKHFIWKLQDQQTGYQDVMQFIEKYQMDNRYIIPIINQLKINFQPPKLDIKKMTINDISNYKLKVLEMKKYDLYQMANHAFIQMNFHNTIGIKKQNLSNFLKKVAEQYIIVPYHNFTHAFNVFQIFLYSYLNSQKVQKFINEKTLFISLIACLCHDMSHKGVGNQYYINKKSLKSVIRSEKSVLENMHCSKLFYLLRKFKEINILEDMNSDDQKQFKYYVVKFILATDMGKHQLKVDKMVAKKKVQEYIEHNEVGEDVHQLIKDNGLDHTNFKNQKFITKLLIHAADLGNPALEYDDYLNWAYLITQEFQDQTSKEQKKKLQQTEFLKYDGVQKFYNGQIFFSSVVVLPLWKEITGYFSELDHLTRNIENNIKRLKDEKDKMST